MLNFTHVLLKQNIKNYNSKNNIIVINKYNIEKRY